MARAKGASGPAKSVRIRDIIQALEARAPGGTAEEWDNIGLLAGDPEWKTSGAVVSIDLTADAIAAARERGYRLIVNHHPAIFPRKKGLARVVPGPGASGLVFEALSQGIAVVSCHTNFDQCSLEVVEAVSKGLNVKPRGRLLESGAGTLVKLVVFVPETHVEPVRRALSEAGAGHIGHYDSCTFGAPGFGTFRGGPESTPFLGRPGHLEKANEIRLETILPRGLKRPVLEALRRAHPYEEVAYDFYAVEQAPAAGGIVRGLGYGFWGDLPRSKPFSEIAKSVRRLFKVHGFWLTDPPPGRIQRIGFVAGKGASFIEAASSAGCDLFITGEAGYHAALDGSRRGMAVLELGHRESERFFAPTMESWLSVLGLGTIRLDLKTQKIWSGGMK